MNLITCPSCGVKNLFESYKCSNCSAILRTKVSNINFWETLNSLLFRTDDTFKKIIYSDHKNYSSILLILFAIKLSQYAFFVFNLTDMSIHFEKFFLILILSITIISIFTYLFVEITRAVFSKIYKQKLLRKNFFSIFGYASSFFSLSIFILLPIEIILFGPYLFSLNPSPFDIKPLPAYTIIGIELIMLFTFIFLLIVGFKVYLNRTSVSILLTTVLVFGFAFGIFLVKHLSTIQ